jgi:hypothetical protein
MKSTPPWQTFGRLHIRLMRFIQCERDFSSRWLSYGPGNDYALDEMTGDGADTVGVWRSNPHAPTILLSNDSPLKILI